MIVDFFRFVENRFARTKNPLIYVSIAYADFNIGLTTLVKYKSMG